MERTNVCPLPLSARSRLARAAASQIMMRHKLSAMSRTACAAFMLNGLTNVCANSGRVAKYGPTTMARMMTIRYGPIQPQDVVMSVIRAVVSQCNGWSESVNERKE